MSSTFSRKTSNSTNSPLGSTATTKRSCLSKTSWFSNISGQVVSFLRIAATITSPEPILSRVNGVMTHFQFPPQIHQKKGYIVGNSNCFNSYKQEFKLIILQKRNVSGV